MPASRTSRLMTAIGPADASLGASGTVPMPSASASAPTPRGARKVAPRQKGEPAREKRKAIQPAWSRRKTPPPISGPESVPAEVPVVVGVAKPPPHASTNNTLRLPFPVRPIAYGMPTDVRARCYRLCRGGGGSRKVSGEICGRNRWRKRSCLAGEEGADVADLDGALGGRQRGEHLAAVALGVQALVEDRHHAAVITGAE